MGHFVPLTSGMSVLEAARDWPLPCGVMAVFYECSIMSRAARQVQKSTTSAPGSRPRHAPRDHGREECGRDARDPGGFRRAETSE